MLADTTARPILKIDDPIYINEYGGDGAAAAIQLAVSPVRSKLRRGRRFHRVRQQHGGTVQFSGLPIKLLLLFSTRTCPRRVHVRPATYGPIHVHASAFLSHRTTLDY